MPCGDGTGPEGFGPMTGRGAGFCAGYNVPGYMNDGPRRGMGRGLGRGRGMGRRGAGRRAMGRRRTPAYRPRPVNNSNVDQTEAEVNYLQQEKEALENELEAIQERILELKDDNKE
ncbi:DUF5320 domain-containing protein [Acetohalobium arabaticum]|uniref:Uncharacterized protein n=1 Tax=Acetohalobium arabaticum (strain ATCC 49924 / DSM 5501 / Z-7288) TaxID=574087 RepID=D9QS05_ACEAZ|nr:DUF5320 domain-containing protein [Acetohalobium arabaticum]ADL13296.1 conserved hypothetical protein [Acetohalobium arabaticum DSM 5501]